MGKTPNTKTLKEKLLDHFESGKSITAIEALGLYGTMTVTNRINELRKLGHKIDDCDVHIRKKGQPPKRYWMEEFISPEERAKHNIPYPEDKEL